MPMNVAHDLVEGLCAAGCTPETVSATGGGGGGGRIDFGSLLSNRPRHGKGDHARAAARMSAAGYSAADLRQLQCTVLSMNMCQIRLYHGW